ncbi:MAG: thioredoxin family protein [Spirochaetaceae bacterium]|nr:thioredoxin family protein [Spirochaetaceae bacterium]|tara:strand:- start:189174 stop:189722 length:549 start_codon:yes stop_codon:yes gene_type:complete
MALLESNQMEKGTPLPEFKLKDVDGKIVRSDQFADVGHLLVVFTCNHCPYAVAAWPLLVDLHKRYRDQGFQIIAINPNNNPSYPDDGFDKMKPFAEKNGIQFPYLFDEDQSVALAYGAVCTPDPYLFHNGKLSYHGRINDNWKDPEAVAERSLELALKRDMGEGSGPDQEFPSMGCSIKWNR